MPRLLVIAGGAVRTAAVWTARHRRTPALLAGLAIGIACWSAINHFVATFGFSRDVVTGLIAACALSFVAGRAAARRIGTEYGLASLIAAGSLVLLPLTLAAAERLVAACPVSLMSVELLRVALLTAAAILVFGLPTMCLGIITHHMSKSRDRAALLAAVGIGIMSEALLLAPVVGLRLPLLIACVLTAIGWFGSVARGAWGDARRTSSLSESLSKSSGTSVRIFVQLVLIGIACDVSGRSLAQLFPEAGYLLAAGVATFMCGSASGAAAHRRLLRRHSAGSARRTGAIIAGSGVMLPLAAFPWLVSRHLDANAFVESVGGVMSLRMATVIASVFPFAFGCGLIARRASATGVVIALAAGLIGGAWLVPAFGVISVAVAVGVGLPALSLAPVTSLAPRTRYGWVATAVGSGLLVVMISQGRNYDPGHAAGLLFSTEAFVSHQHGVPEELLPFVSDRRLIAISEEPQGTVSVWKNRGTAITLSVDGIPMASTALSDGLCPPPSADVMSVALPMILHESAGSLLILGDTVGSSTAVAAGFPLREIVCYDEHPEGPASFGRPRSTLADERVHSFPIAPRLGLLIERRRFDVVVSDPGPPAVLPNVACFTREFYEAAAGRLKVGGLFCQRLQYADFGIEPFREIAATMRSVFGDLLTVEIGPGQYAFVGSLPGDTVVREGLLERLKRQHVRRMLARLGWDWSVPLNLLAVDGKGLEQLAAEAAATNTASNGHFAYSLPQEMMRWGPKSRELAAGTSNCTTRLVMSLPDDQRREATERIAEVAAQRELMVKFPDQPWAYRKEIRAKLIEAPRSVIRPVSGQIRRVRHPDDQHRLDYFEALGKAIGQTTPKSLFRLESFAEPYDPLVTYFLHHEIAPLYDECGIAGELSHRLYTAYYSDPRDRSVRDVTRTLELVASHPEFIPGDADRFDQFNSLVEILLRRWEARGLTEPRSPEVVMTDIELSLDAIDTAMHEMESLAPSAGLAEEDWQLRKRAIERTLIRPLGKYRTTLLPHLRKAQRKTAAQGADTDEADMK